MQQPQPRDAPAHPGIPDASAAHPAGQPVRAVIAARLSQLQRDGRQGIGIDTQDEKSRAFCEREGIIVVHVAADTKSGTVAPWDRKNLKPWVTDPERMSMYDAIVAYKTDRLSRGTQEDFTRIEYWATSNGKRLIIVDGPQYPARKDKHDSDYWQWHAEKMASRKEWEADRERVLRATDKLRRENKLVGSVPWGFTAEGPKYDKRLVATDLGREYIPKIFDMVIDGHSLADVCQWLDSLHLRHKRDPVTGELTDLPWWPTVVGKMIKNPAYRGHYWMTRVERDPETGQVVWSGKWEHSCEALIDARRFRLANDALARREKRGPKGDPMSRAMLRGAIRCPDCDGSPMNKIKTRGSSKAGSETITYYRCWGTGSLAQGLREYGADGRGGRGGEPDHGHHVPCPGQAAHPDQGQRPPGRAGRDQPPDQGTGPGHHDRRAVRRRTGQAARGAGPAQDPARAAGPVGRAAHWGAVRRHLPGSPRLGPRRVAGLARVRDPRHEERSQRDPGGRAGDSSPWVITLCSGVKVQPFHVAVNRCPHDGHA